MWTPEWAHAITGGQQARICYDTQPLLSNSATIHFVMLIFLKACMENGHYCFIQNCNVMQKSLRKHLESAYENESRKLHFFYVAKTLVTCVIFMTANGFVTYKQMFIKLWSFSARWFLRQFRKKKHFENCNRH
jgi:hypothetical protein